MPRAASQSKKDTRPQSHLLPSSLVSILMASKCIFASQSLSLWRVSIIFVKLLSWYDHTAIPHSNKASFCFLGKIFIDCQHLESWHNHFVLFFWSCEINFISLINLLGKCIFSNLTPKSDFHFPFKFSLQYHPWINHSSNENKENDH